MKKPFRPRMESLEDRRTPGETFESILPLLTVGPLALPLMLSEPNSDHFFQPDSGSGRNHQPGGDLSLGVPDPGVDNVLVTSRDQTDTRNVQDLDRSATVSIANHGTASSRLADSFGLGPTEDLGWLPVGVGARVDLASSSDSAVTGSAALTTPVVSIESGSVGGGFTRPTPPVVMSPNVSQSLSHPDVVAGIQTGGDLIAASAELVDTGGGVTWSPMEYTTVSNMTATDDLWWFGGESPTYYSTSITLTVDNPGSYYGYKWTIADGTEMVDFSGLPGQDSANYSYGGTPPSISVVSTAASTALNDVLIEVQGWDASLQQWGAVIGSVSLAVPRPHHLVSTKIVDKANATFGYESWLHYRIEDQFSKVLPRRVVVNEHFSGPPVSDFAGETWTVGIPNGGMVDPADLADKIEGHALPVTPAPHAPPPVGPPGIRTCFTTC